MPETKNTWKRLQILDSLLKNNDLSAEDLLGKCNQILASEGLREVGKRTIQGDLKLIEEKYGAQITKCHSGHTITYQYTDPSFSILDQMIAMPSCDQNVIRQSIANLKETYGDADNGFNPLYQWIVAILNNLEQGRPIVPNQVVEFDACPLPANGNHFSELQKHILNKEVLEITYEPFKKSARTHTVHPYRLKQFNRRWFLVGLHVFPKEQKRGPQIYVYPLDRIHKIQRSSNPFIEPKVDLNHYFDDIYGITLDHNTPVENVVLRVTNERFKYIKTKPIHPSFTISRSKSSDLHTVFTIRVRPNKELESLILSFGEDMEVLEPASLRATIENKLQKMQKLYRRSSCQDTQVS